MITTDSVYSKWKFQILKLEYIPLARANKASLAPAKNPTSIPGPGRFRRPQSRPWHKSCPRMKLEIAHRIKFFPYMHGLTRHKVSSNLANNTGEVSRTNSTL